jgi:hypothetical protein
MRVSLQFEVYYLSDTPVQHQSIQNPSFAEFGPKIFPQRLIVTTTRVVQSIIRCSNKCLKTSGGEEDVCRSRDLDMWRLQQDQQADAALQQQMPLDYYHTKHELKAN